ncbi:hypothetical protein DTO045G8_7230 [Paecilomyces variotii]|nr:hypothetical protein DTO045G8_7230 [Paecilomyces variotii]
MILYRLSIVLVPIFVFEKLIISVGQKGNCVRFISSVVGPAISRNRPFLNYLSELTSAERFRDSIILATAWLLESSAPIRPAVPSFALTGIEGWTKLIV